MPKSITVLGGGNTAFAAAAKLTLEGARVTLCELPEFRDAVTPIEASRGIALEGVAGRGEAALESVTTDFSHALGANELVLLSVAG